MSDTTKKILKTLGMLVVFIVCLLLVIFGQNNFLGAVSRPIGLLIMLGGVAGLVILLWIYNRRFQ